MAGGLVTSWEFSNLSLTPSSVTVLRFFVLLHTIALLHDCIERVSPGRPRMARRTHPSTDGLLQRRRYPNVEIDLRGAPAADGAVPEPRREGVIEGHQPVLGTHAGTSTASISQDAQAMPGASSVLLSAFMGTSTGRSTGCTRRTGEGTPLSHGPEVTGPGLGRHG